MNTAVMKTFCDLVDMGSFSRAAEANGISQSAVSQQVAGLERELGTPLLIRGDRFAMPTDAGKAFYRGAKDILRRYDEMVAQVRNMKRQHRPVLRIGTIYSVGFYLLDPYVRRFLKAHPGVGLDIEYARWNEITAAVLAGEMDLGILAFPERHRSLEIIPFTTEEMVMVCAPRHRLAGRDHIDPADLKGERFVAFEANVPTRQHIDRVLKGLRVPVEITMAFDNNETLKRAVEVGAGLSILPANTVERESAAGHLRVVPFREPGRWARKITILRRRGQARSDTEMKFLRILRSKV